MPRSYDRTPGDLRPITFELDYQLHPAASVLVAMGRTRIIVSASVENGVPRWMKADGKTGGWITGEYSMLPGSTGYRKQREISRGKADSRGVEIQRLIGRALRAAVNMEQIGERIITIDCDVLDADGGTRCAAITGGAVALKLALRRLFLKGDLKVLPEIDDVAAVSVGIVDGTPVLDLDYSEDVRAEVDMNVVMTGSGKLIEMQGTAEKGSFTRAQANAMLDLAEGGIAKLVEAQQAAIRGKQ